jgi:hypothetical protein
MHLHANQTCPQPGDPTDDRACDSFNQRGAYFFDTESSRGLEFLVVPQLSGGQDLFDFLGDVFTDVRDLL